MAVQYYISIMFEDLRDISNRNGHICCTKGQEILIFSPCMDKADSMLNPTHPMMRLEALFVAP